MAAEPEGEVIQIRILWRGLDTQPLHYANQFIVQHDPSGIYLTAGHLQPPMLLGSPEEQQRQARELGNVFADTVGRMFISRRQAGQLLVALQDQIEHYDKQEELGNASIDPGTGS